VGYGPLNFADNIRGCDQFMTETRYLVMLNVLVDGSYNPIPFQQENLSPNKAIIIVDDVTEVVWVWIGSKVTVVQRSIASRASNYIAKYGYMVEQYKVGTGFTRRLIEEQFLEDLEESQETYSEFFQLFSKNKTKHNGYYTVEIEGIVRGSVLDRDEFQAAKETMQTWLEGALLVIDGIEEGEVSAEEIPQRVQAVMTTPKRSGIGTDQFLGFSDESLIESREPPPLPQLPEEHRELRDGIVFSALLQLRPEGFVGRIIEEDNSRSFMLIDESGDLIATVRVKFDDTGRIQIDTYDFKFTEFESIFLRKFGELTSFVI